MRLDESASTPKNLSNTFELLEEQLTNGLTAENASNTSFLHFYYLVRSFRSLLKLISLLFLVQSAIDNSFKIRLDHKCPQLKRFCQVKRTDPKLRRHNRCKEQKAAKHSGLNSTVCMSTTDQSSNDLKRSKAPSKLPNGQRRYCRDRSSRQRTRSFQTTTSGSSTKIEESAKDRQNNRWAGQ